MRCKSNTPPSWLCVISIGMLWGTLVPSQTPSVQAAEAGRDVNARAVHGSGRSPATLAPVVTGRALSIEDGAVAGTAAHNGPTLAPPRSRATAEPEGNTPIMDGLRDAKRAFQSALDRARHAASPSDRMQQMSRSHLDADLDGMPHRPASPTGATPPRGTRSGDVASTSEATGQVSARDAHSALPDRLRVDSDQPGTELMPVATEDEPALDEHPLPTRLATRPIANRAQTEPEVRDAVPVESNAAPDGLDLEGTARNADADNSTDAAPVATLRPSATPSTPDHASGRLSATFSSRRGAAERAESARLDIEPSTTEESAARTPAAPIGIEDSGSAVANKSVETPYDATPGSGNPLVIANTGPSISVRTQGANKLVVGKPSQYTVFVTNSGDVEANDVVVTVHVPSWVEVADKHPSGGRVSIENEGDQSSEVRWLIQQLPARGSEKMELRIVPRESRPVDLAVRWTFTPVASTAQIEVQEPKLEMTLSGPPDIYYGETKIYTITVSNPGTGDTEHVVLNLLPLAPGRDTNATQELGTLRPGERRSIDVELIAQQAGRLQVRAHAFADGGLRAEASQDVVVRRARLEIEAVGAATKYAGTLSTYQVRIVNAGDATATNVIAVAALPHGAVFKSATEGGKLDVQCNEVRWNIGALRPGAARLMDLGCELTQAGDNRLDVRSEADTDLTAVHSVVTRVEALADLKLVVNDPPGAVAVGSDAQYEVRVINRGTKAAENVQIVGYFSDGIEPVSLQGGKGDVGVGQVVLQPIARLNPGQEMVFVITARATAPGNHVFRTELECGVPYTRLAAEEWTTYYGGPVSDASTQAQLSR